MPKMLPKRRPTRSRSKADQAHNADHHGPDLLLLLVVAAITIFGIIMVTNVSAYEGYQAFHNNYYFIKQQLVWLLIGVTAGILAYKIRYGFFLKLSPLFLLGAIVCLILVLIPGLSDETLGARRWLNVTGFFPFLPGLTVQPGELVKPAVILYFTAWLSSKKATFTMKRLAIFLAIIGMILGLVMLEPDLGTTVVIVSIIAGLYFVAGAPLLQFGLLIPLGLIGVLGLIAIEPYRMQRLLTFLNPQIDPQGASYHISQILMTLGSGGLFGVGLGNSTQKYGYLPEATTDSIFAVIGGELGFIGSLVLIAAFTVLIFRGITIANKLEDKTASLLAVGITLWIGMQIIVNIGSMVALFPLTGIPLPFISYGGSSLVMVFFGVGLLLNLSRYTKSAQKLRPSY